MSERPEALKRRGAGTLRQADAGQRVLLQAWVQRRRDHGGLLFFDLRDRSGIAQVVVRPEDRPEVATALAAVRAEWVIEVEGIVAARQAGKANPDLASGAIEVVAERAVVLSRSEPLPFNLDGKIDAGEDLRLRYRYLELRRPELLANFVLRDKVALTMRSYFHDRDFLEVETPILTRSTPEGARDYLVPSRVHRGSFYALPQSPQLFKQILMVAGFERYIQIARCFRDEDLRADRQPEFTQLDLEMSFPTEETIFELIEGLFAQVFPLGGITPPERYPRLTYAESMLRYGTDRPDLRFDLPIVDLTARLGESGFRGFKEAAATGGVVRGLAVPGAAEASRKEVDEWAELARRYGAAGVLTLRRRGGVNTFQVKGALTDAEIEGVVADLALPEGGIALLAAGAEGVVAAALGALRSAVARREGPLPRDRHAFVWVTDFPLLEWRDDRWTSVHHPFTSPDLRDLGSLENEPGKVRARAYDVVVDGMELGGGSIRIHDPELQQQVFETLGIRAEEAEARFGFFLEALRYGAPPHGGIALGLDRMVMVLAGAASIREVIAFPKTASATDLMTAAPSTVERAQLRELGLAPQDE